MNRGIKIFLAITTALIIPGAIWLGMGMYALTKLCYEMVGYKITNFSFTNLSITFILKVKNPSHIRIKIKGYNINIELNGLPVANLISKTKNILKPEQISILNLPVSISITQLLSGDNRIKDVINYFSLKQYDKIVVNLRGNFNGEILGFSIPIKINERMTLNDIIKIMNEPTEKC